MTASPKMDDDGLTREQIEKWRVSLNAAIALVPNHHDDWYRRKWAHLEQLCSLALRALESRSEVLEEAYNALNKFDDDVDMEDYESVAGWWTKRGGPALNAIRALKSPRAEPGAPHEYTDPSTGAVEEHGPASAAPERARPDAIQPDMSDYDRGLRDGRARGLEEAAKVCDLLAETCLEEKKGWDLNLGERLSGRFEVYGQHSDGAIKKEQLKIAARMLRAKIKPTRGET